MNLHNLCIATLLFPLCNSLIIGLFGNYFNNKVVNILSIVASSITTLITLYFVWGFFVNDFQDINSTWYVWGISGGTQFKIGFLLDRLNIVMLFMVSTISLVVQVYSIEYMREEISYKRFFSYISFFTFAMYLLIIANNFLQLFIGWELVGLASYLLIGFWFKKESATRAALKAFLINRIGDIGLLLSISAIYLSCNTLDYIDVFKILPQNLQYINLICILLFIGVIAKSAQIPLHIWLPDSMEAPTPVSALIHSATMVVAGVYLLARMSPIFEHSEYCLNIILITGAVTAFLISILAIIERDIKRIMAYSTISQLGIMIVAMGVSAYPAGMLHLITHAFFKSLLFLGAGSIILATNQIQDIYNMPLQLKKYLPTTYWCMLIGSLAISGFPCFSGSFSKDLILKTVELSKLPFANSAYYLLLATIWITAFYSFRLMFIVFDKKVNSIEQQSTNFEIIKYKNSKIINIPLIFLSIFSVILGGLLIQLVLSNKLFGASIFILSKHNIIKDPSSAGFINYYSALCAIFGIAVAFVLYYRRPHWSGILRQSIQNNFLFLYKLFGRQYCFNDINRLVVVVAQIIARFFAEIVDKLLIDKLLIITTTKVMVGCSKAIQKLQTGYLYHYVFFMLTGVLIILSWFLFHIY